MAKNTIENITQNVKHKTKEKNFYTTADVAARVTAPDIGEREKKKSRADKRARSGCWLCAWVFVCVCMLGQIFNTYFLNGRRNKWQRKKRFSMSKEYQARLTKFIACSICLNASNNEIIAKIRYCAVSLTHTHSVIQQSHRFDSWSLTGQYNGQNDYV